jgi:hypothetical protein
MSSSVTRKQDSNDLNRHSNGRGTYYYVLETGLLTPNGNIHYIIELISEYISSVAGYDSSVPDNCRSLTMMPNVGCRWKLGTRFQRGKEGREVRIERRGPLSVILSLSEHCVRGSRERQRGGGLTLLKRQKAI